jgi:hypothetical protein
LAWEAAASFAGAAGMKTSARTRALATNAVLRTDMWLLPRGGWQVLGEIRPSRGAGLLVGPDVGWAQDLH